MLTEKGALNEDMGTADRLTLQCFKWISDQLLPFILHEWVYKVLAETMLGIIHYLKLKYKLSNIQISHIHSERICVGLEPVFIFSDSVN